MGAIVVAILPAQSLLDHRAMLHARRPAILFSFVFLAGANLIGCSGRQQASSTSTTASPAPAAVTPLPASAALKQILAGAPEPEVTHGRPTTWPDVLAFYQNRAGALAWSRDDDMSKAEQALEVLRAAPSHGFAAEDYGESQIVQMQQAMAHPSSGAGNAADRDRQAAELDVRITGSLLSLGHDVALGRTTPETIDPRWKARRAAPDFAGTLNNAAGSDVKTWLDTLRPPHPEYAALELALDNLSAVQRQGGWPTLPTTTRLKLGQSDPAVITLRQRLSKTGELGGAAAASASPIFDADVSAAVRAFQDHHAIAQNGILDAPTIAAMNVPVDAQIEKIAINMERWRWMPDDFGSRYLFVNIPAYHLTARENGKAVMESKVIVGKVGMETPVLSAVMTTVVFSPYWNIPDSIVQGETAPAMLRDPGYLAKNDIEILRVSNSGAAPVDPSTVHWNKPSELRQLALRQRPGAKNALGHVKFVLPNPFDIYLHDTPADELFDRLGRAFSHGCIRLEEPEVMANYVLRGDPEWDAARIAAAMNAGVEKQVKLKQMIPVHIVYFTAWVDDAGGLHVGPDVYKYDTKQSAQHALR